MVNWYTNTLVHRYTNTPTKRYTGTPVHRYTCRPVPAVRITITASSTTARLHKILCPFGALEGLGGLTTPTPAWFPRFRAFLHRHVVYRRSCGSQVSPFCRILCSCLPYPVRSMRSCDTVLYIKTYQVPFSLFPPLSPSPIPPFLCHSLPVVLTGLVIFSASRQADFFCVTTSRFFLRHDKQILFCVTTNRFFLRHD